MNKIILFLKGSIANLIILKKNIDKKKIIFSSSNNNSFDYNSKYLFLHMINNRSFQCKYVINDKEKREKLKEEFGDYFIETKSMKGIIECLSAGIWFTSAGLPVYSINLKKNRKIINLWHGIPLKKIALKEENLNKIIKIYFKYIFSKNYSYIVTTSKNLINIYSESFGVEKNKVKVLGQPRTDYLIEIDNKKEVLKKFYNKLPYFNRAILYAPTHREDKEVELFPFKDFNLNELDKFLRRNNIIIFIRKHKFNKDDISLNSDYIVEIGEEIIEDITEYLNLFDLLITDYSSIYLDYLLLNRPIAFIPYDKEEYLKDRGMNFEYNDVTPGPQIRNFLEFKTNILELLEKSSFYDKERREVLNYFYDIKKNSCEIIEKFIEEN